MSQKDTTSVGDEEETYITQRDLSGEENEEEEHDYEESDIDDSNQSFDLSLKSQSVITSPEPLNSPNAPEISRKRKASEVTKTKSSKSAKRGKTNKSEYLDDMELTLIRDLGNAVKSEAKEKPLDEVDTYVKSLAADLRRLQQT